MALTLLHACLSVVLLASPAHAVVTYVTSANGFTDPARGWNSWALQADDNQIDLNEASVLEQCNAMAAIMNVGGMSHDFTYCSIDSGWSLNQGDEYGRIVNDPARFPNMTTLADNLREKGLQLGVYLKPGFFKSDVNKTISGTDGITLGSIAYNEKEYLFDGRYSINYTAPGAQEYCDSNIELFASWGVEYIKLDHVTPGTKGPGLPHNNSGIAICYHRAIDKVVNVKGQKKIRLALSPKLDLSSEYFKVWSSNADSLRIAGDINHPSSSNDGKVLVEWPRVQRTLAFLRNFLCSRSPDEKLHIRPDLDTVLVGNGGELNNLTDAQRLTTLAHYAASGANILLGSDMTKLDAFGRQWLTDPQIWAVADFSAQYPMRPVGSYKAQPPPPCGVKGEQFQSYVAGPDATTGAAVLLVTNYGASGDNSYYITPYKGTLTYTITQAMLQSFGLTRGCYTVLNVLAASPTDLPHPATSISVELGDSESVLYRLSPGGAGCAGDDDSHAGEL